MTWRSCLYLVRWSMTHSGHLFDVQTRSTIWMSIHDPTWTSYWRSTSHLWTGYIFWTSLGHLWQLQEMYTWCNIFLHNLYCFFCYFTFPGLSILSNQVIFLCMHLFLHSSVYLFGNAVCGKGSVNNFMVAYPPYS